MKLVSILIVSCIIGSLFMSYGPFTETCRSEEDKPICWVNRVRNKILVKYTKKYHLKVTGIIDGMPGRVIHTVGVYFRIYEVISKYKARQIVVECAQDFIREFNSSSELRPYYKTYPLTTENLDISLFIFHPDGYSTLYPELGVVSVSLGVVRFDTYDPDRKYRYKTTEEEKFEDAVALVAAQKELGEGQ